MRAGRGSRLALVRALPQLHRHALCHRSKAAAMRDTGMCHAQLSTVMRTAHAKALGWHTRMHCRCSPLATSPATAPELQQCAALMCTMSSSERGVRSTLLGPRVTVMGALLIARICRL